MKFIVRQRIKNWLIEHPSINPYRFTFEKSFRHLTADLRLKPDFLILGYPKCGTTSLYDYLVQHPNVGSTYRKEINFFNLSFSKGMRWYKNHFPLIFKKFFFEKKFHSNFITGEATPLYISHPLALSRIKSMFPNIKLILLLRNPIDRSFSHFHHQRRGKLEPIEFFDEVITLDKERNSILNKKLQNNEINETNQGFFMPPYIEMGKYVKDIEKLFSLFDKKQIMIILTDDLNKNRDDVLKKVHSFLEIPSFIISDFSHKNVGHYESIKLETRKSLIDFYKPYNQELEHLLGLKLNWDI
jgi:hypothetical protein